MIHYWSQKYSPERSRGCCAFPKAHKQVGVEGRSCFNCYFSILWLPAITPLPSVSPLFFYLLLLQQSIPQRMQAMTTHTTVLVWCFVLVHPERKSWQPIHFGEHQYHFGDVCPVTFTSSYIRPNYATTIPISFHISRCC